jgi:lysyl-tRNA synthetase class 1
MTEDIIGHGTWYDKTAVEIIEREKRLGRNLNLIRTEMGIGASGLPHIGSFSDGARSYAVTLALQEQGHNSELIAFSDDKDGLRKVPAGFPKWLEKHLGFPVTAIPDPAKCHESFGAHVISLLEDAFDRCGIAYRLFSGTEVYRRGLLNEEIKTLLMNAERVGKIVREEVGQERYEEVLPYFPVCANCGRIYTTNAYEFLPKENKILYTCEGMEIKGRWLKGCGHRGEVDYTTGEGKLSWKAGEFAARWKALDIRFEAYGKDIADSVRVNDRISREILGYEPPTHTQYEMFLDKSGRRISMSVGNVFTPQVWFRYGSPQSLALLTLKRFVGTRAVSVTDIPQYMNELDELERVYFGEKTLDDEKEHAKLSGLYQYCWMMNPPPDSMPHVPYNLLTYLVKVAPPDTGTEYILEKLREYGYVKDEIPVRLKQRITLAANWANDFMEIIESPVSLSGEETVAIEELIQVLKRETDEESIQSAIFHIARNQAIRPRHFFKTLYTILIGTSEGPKLGPYIAAMGPQNVVDALEKAIEQH